MTEIREHDAVRARSALLPIAILAIVKLIAHTWINQQYGFHRDELATLDDARHLAWGFVAYPPLTPFLGRIELALFGTSLAGFRFLAAAAQSVVMILTAMIARDLGGNRKAQWLAALAVIASPVSLAASSLFQYVSFDFLWWVLLAFLVVRLVRSNAPRLWVPIGAVIGLGVMTKYTIVFLVAGLVPGVLTSPRLRAHLRSPWLWAGVALSLAVAAPNMLWQLQHDFITLDFLKHIHACDVRIGRTDDFLLHQLFVPASLFAAPLWICGLVALFASKHLRQFRILGIMFVVAVGLFTVAKGRDYYTAPLYPMLIAAGAAWIFERLDARPRTSQAVFASGVLLMIAALGTTAFVATPVSRPGTRAWRKVLSMNGDLREEFGWPELVGEVARVWSTLSPAERSRAAIYCENYGEAGAVNLYGPAHGLPAAISGVNSFWARGYGDPPPQTLIAVGVDRSDLELVFESVTVAGQIPNPMNVRNEESGHPEIYVCRGLRVGWRTVWENARSFG